MIILSLAIFLAFLFTIVAIYGIPTDISHIYKLLPDKLKWIFRAWFPAFLLPIGMITEDKPIVRIGLILIFGVAMFPEFWQKVNKVYHVIFAMGGIITVMAGILIETNKWYLPLIWALLILPLTLNLNNKVSWLKWYYIPNKIFWVEFSACMFAIGGLL